MSVCQPHLAGVYPAFGGAKMSGAHNTIGPAKKNAVFLEFTGIFLIKNIIGYT